ncbi:MAG: GGDEF domain-containing protein [Lachnospiraceae bacterium]|nr:GGDEF domain-containing protein [Lachnospiraceae bacterium]
MFKWIKKYLLYAGVERDEYEQVKESIVKGNRNIALVFSSVAVVLIGVMLTLSFILEDFGRSKPVYIFGTILSACIFLVAVGAKKYKGLSYLAVYMAESVFLIYGIVIGTVTRPEQQTVTFMVMMLLIPLIFVDRPIRMGGCTLFYIIVFIVAAIHTKTPDILAVDVTDAIIFGILAIASGTIVICVKVKSYVLEKKLQIMSETDQPTGLNNWNSYEWRLDSYPKLCRKSICCIYVDVNGLHQLNNTEGHKAGDEMLQFIAKEVQTQFGTKDTYRIGGDEFVAFALDVSEDYVKDKLDQLTSVVTDAHYHVAIGYELQDNDIQMNLLISNAEAKMYADKSAYYKQHDRRR